MRKVPWLVLGCVVAIVVIVFWRANRGAAAVEDDTATSRLSSDALPDRRSSSAQRTQRKQLSELKQALSVLAETGGHQVEDTRPSGPDRIDAGASEGAAGSDGKPTKAPSVSPDRELASGHFRFFDDVLDQQAPDSQWTDSVERAVVSEYRDSPGVNVAEVKCGGTLCRLEIDTTEDDRNANKVISRQHKIPSFEAELTVRISQAPEPPRAVVYFSKKGMQLPSPVQ